MMQVLCMLAEGLKTKEIASELGVSNSTIDFHWSKLKQRLGLRSFVDACRYAVKHGFVKL